MTQNQAVHPHYTLVEAAIRLMDANQPAKLNIETLCNQLGVSMSHLQHVFRDWAGLTLKQFSQALQKPHALRAIRQSSNLLEASLESGLSGPGRLHDLTVKLEAATPGEIKSGGEGLQIEYGCGETPVGTAFVATTSRGICSLQFLGADLHAAQALERLQNDWPNARLLESPGMADRICASLFDINLQQQVVVRASDFQLKVWQALIEIPEGQLTTYGSLAHRCGHPKAARAIGTAVAGNPVGWLIPCHRVIRQTGAFGEYRWGHDRKVALHLLELGRHRP